MGVIFIYKAGFENKLRVSYRNLLYVGLDCIDPVISAKREYRKSFLLPLPLFPKEQKQKRRKIRHPNAALYIMGQLRQKCAGDCDPILQRCDLHYKFTCHCR